MAHTCLPAPGRVLVALAQGWGGACRRGGNTPRQSDQALQLQWGLQRVSETTVTSPQEDGTPRPHIHTYIHTRPAEHTHAHPRASTNPHAGGEETGSSPSDSHLCRDSAPGMLCAQDQLKHLGHIGSWGAQPSTPPMASSTDVLTATSPEQADRRVGQRGLLCLSPLPPSHGHFQACVCPR